MKVKMSSNTVIGVIFMAISVLMIFQIKNLPQDVGLSMSGPGFFPKIITVVIILTSVALIIQDLTSTKMSFNVTLAKEDGVRVLKLILISILYIFLIKKFGYIITTALLLASSIFLFNYRKSVPIVTLSIIFPIAISLLFEQILRVQLP